MLDLLNANVRNFAHPLKHIVLNLYTCISTDRQSLHSSSSLRTNGSNSPPAEHILH